MNATTFCREFKERITNIFIQNWKSDIDDNEALTIYKHAKIHFEYERYLDICKYRNYRHEITRIRLSSHSLRIETGIYGQNRIPRHERNCQFCASGDIEDEYHFIIICDKYNNLRTKYLPQYYRRNPSVFKFIQLLHSQNSKIVNNLSYFIHHAFKLRNGTVAN